MSKGLYWPVGITKGVKVSIARMNTPKQHSLQVTRLLHIGFPRLEVSTRINVSTMDCLTARVRVSDTPRYFQPEHHRTESGPEQGYTRRQEPFQ